MSVRGTSIEDRLPPSSMVQIIKDDRTKEVIVVFRFPATRFNDATFAQKVVNFANEVTS